MDSVAPRTSWGSAPIVAVHLRTREVGEAPKRGGKSTRLRERRMEKSMENLIIHDSTWYMFSAIPAGLLIFRQMIAIVSGEWSWQAFISTQFPPIWGVCSQPSNSVTEDLSLAAVHNLIIIHMIYDDVRHLKVPGTTICQHTSSVTSWWFMHILYTIDIIHILNR
jgi:hypothetical protein